MAFGQEEGESESEKHSLSLILSHAYISQGKIEGQREWFAAPAFGINYNYKLNDKWTIGFHNDIIIESFVVEDSKATEDVIQREYPISNIIFGTYKISEAWGIGAGAGLEWERNENFGLIRVGTEYAFALTESGLEVVFSVNYDGLINAYDSINFGVGINKFFK